MVLAKDRHSNRVSEYDRCDESPVIEAVRQLTNKTVTNQTDNEI